MEVLKTVLQDRVQQRTVEQIVDAPVLQAVELAEVSKVFSQDRIQQRTVEQTIPDIPLAEKIVELPVIQTEEKTRQGVNTLAQHVVDTVEVERPKIIGETVQKPIIQEKINPVTKHVEVPLSQFTGKAMDIPVVAQRQIFTETVQKTIEISQLKHTDHVDDVPAVLMVEQETHVHVVAKTPEIPQLQITDKVIDVRAVSAIQAPRVRVVKKTVEDSQPQIVEKITQIPEVLTVQGLALEKGEFDRKRKRQQQQKHNNEQQTTRQVMQEQWGERGRRKREGEKGTNRKRPGTEKGRKGS